ncbi:UDP-N-acetylglucosamine 1-carboxyvinyltransferase [Forsythia ovata]|uniref:UDP-N-acetylglucosamine 1-carboxyvinyltransferase n=1 Tax=Forsythia ovata TaxID=205694 RepID=A0ABD1SAK4_9LAMI
MDSDFGLISSLTLSSIPVINGKSLTKLFFESIGTKLTHFPTLPALSSQFWLSGHVTISGSKNSALAILAATLCCSGTSKLKNVPNLSDTRTMASILGSLGAEIEFSDNEVVVNTDRVGSVEPESSDIGKIRGGFFVIGPLLGRFGEAVVGLPGGCDIGARPIDIYVRGLQALGAVVEVRDGKVQAYAANGKGLVGGRFHLDYPSVGATETLMMAACMAEGKTFLTNVAREPEIIDLASFLTESGACVQGAGSDKIYICGKNQLHGSEYGIMPDRVETGTFILAAAITRSCISLSPVFCSLSSFLDKLSGAGCKIIHRHNNLQLSAVPASRGHDLRGFNVKTQPYPGFPTDLQPQTMALLSTCSGSSIIEETVFENRMSHVRELQKFGAKIEVCGSTALAFGKERGSHFSGTQVTATDLRGGMSLVLAGLASEGITEISGISHIDRGYENLETKLCLIGADIKRLDLNVCHTSNFNVPV